MITRFSLIREKSIKRVHHFLVPQKNIYTNNWKNIPCIQESLHSSGGFLFSYQQTSGKMFLHSLALSCPFLTSFLTPIQVLTDQIIICRSIGYVGFSFWSHVHWGLHERQRNNWTVGIVRAQCMYEYIM